MSDKQVTPESFVLDPRADSDADDIPVQREAPVPDELIETAEDGQNVQDGKI
ncbi:hypothetical protein D3C72_1915620 [compost metagenome]